jgi:hypothetical protein
LGSSACSFVVKGFCRFWATNSQHPLHLTSSLFLTGLHPRRVAAPQGWTPVWGKRDANITLLAQSSCSLRAVLEVPAQDHLVRIPRPLGEKQCPGGHLRHTKTKIFVKRHSESCKATLQTHNYGALIRDTWHGWSARLRTKTRTIFQNR